MMNELEKVTGFGAVLGSVWLCTLHPTADVFTVTEAVRNLGSWEPQAEWRQISAEAK